MAAPAPLRRLEHRARKLALRGSGRHCPCCGARWRRFATFRGREEALCPGCGALERHRFLCLYIDSLGKPAGPVLHFAPEPVVAARFLGLGHDEYLSVDIEPGKAELAADICALPLADDRFALTICSHVLEHVTAEKEALTELHRVCAPSGTVLIMVPRSTDLATTEEDPTVLSPAERLRRFGQEDHVRRYGADLETRFERAGFEVEVVPPGMMAAEPDQRRHGLDASDEICVCRPLG